MSKICGMLAGTKIVVKPNGAVLPCEAFKDGKWTTRLILGNIKEDSMETCMKRYDTNPVINLLRWFYEKPVPDPDFDLYKVVEENQDVFLALIRHHIDPAKLEIYIDKKNRT